MVKLIFFGANSKDIVGEVYIQLKENRLISAKVKDCNSNYFKKFLHLRS